MGFWTADLQWASYKCGNELGFSFFISLSLSISRSLSFLYLSLSLFLYLFLSFCSCVYVNFVSFSLSLSLCFLFYFSSPPSPCSLSFCLIRQDSFDEWKVIPNLKWLFIPTKNNEMLAQPKNWIKYVKSKKLTFKKLTT